MELAQKDQLLEIGSRARLGKPIICKGLSVPCDKSRALRTMKFEQIFSLRCQTEQAESLSSPQTHFRMTFLSPTLHLAAILRPRCTTILADRVFTTILADRVLVEPDGIEPTTSCLQSRRSPS